MLHQHFTPAFPDGWPLAPLTALEHLEVSGRFMSLPTCLPELTQLRSLVVHETCDADTPEGRQAADACAARALPRLRALTHLVCMQGWLPCAASISDRRAPLPAADNPPFLHPSALQCLNGFRFSPPDLLASLTQLRRLTWKGRHDERLPRGPWLDSLQQLSVTGAVAAASLPALASARQLEELTVWGGSDEELVALFSWAVGNGLSLQTLTFNRYSELGPDAQAADAALKAARPSLRIVQQF